MASLGFEYVAHEAVSSPFVFVVTKMEAPEYWHLSRISGHRLKEGPYQHEEEKVVYD